MLPSVSTVNYYAPLPLVTTATSHRRTFSFRSCTAPYRIPSHQSTHQYIYLACTHFSLRFNLRSQKITKTHRNITDVTYDPLPYYNCYFLFVNTYTANEYNTKAYKINDTDLHTMRSNMYYSRNTQIYMKVFMFVY